MASSSISLSASASASPTPSASLSFSPSPSPAEEEGHLRLPIITTTGRRGNGYTTGTSVPKPTVTAQGAWPGLELTVPLATIEATGINGEAGYGDVVVPVPTVTMKAGEWARIEVPCIQITINAAEKAYLEVPLIEVTAQGKQNILGWAEITVPVPGVTITLADKASITVPLAMLTATGLTGTIGQARFNVPNTGIAAHGDSPMLGRISLAVPIPRVSGGESRDTRAQVSITVPLVRISPTLLIGRLGQASVSMPLAEVDATGYLNLGGTASIEVPLPSLIMNVPETVIVVDVAGDVETVTGYALVLNLDNNALTEYDNYAFNSFAYFNGKYLGASETGIFNLTGRNDNDTAINAKARTGLQDGDAANRKGVEDAFIGVSTDGILGAKIIGDDKKTYQGRAIAPRNDDLVTERVKFGKGIKSRYLGMEIENKDGCDFTIDSVELTIIPLTRKM